MAILALAVGTALATPPASHYLDRSDPDVLVLRRQDGTFVAAFSAQGATMEGIHEAAKEDYVASLARARAVRKARRGRGRGGGAGRRGVPRRRRRRGAGP